MPFPETQPQLYSTESRALKVVRFGTQGHLHRFSPRRQEEQCDQKEKGESSGSNIKKCPVNNRKKIPGTEVKGEDRRLVDPGIIDRKKLF